MNDDEYQKRAARRLRALALEDMRVYRERTSGMNACDDESMRVPRETALLVGELKRVRRTKRALHKFLKAWLKCKKCL